jgi:nitroreductase
MELFEAIVNRKTANSAFADKKVSQEHIDLLVKMASHSPSHFNSQPWRFIAVTDEEIIGKIAKIAGDSMVQLMMTEDSEAVQEILPLQPEEMEKPKTESTLTICLQY